MTHHPPERPGYGRPPRSGRFQPGRSGNPKGRPKGSKRTLPYEAVFGRLVTIIEDGVQKQVTAEEAIIRMLLKDGLTGADAATLDLLNLVEPFSEDSEGDEDHAGVDTIIIRAMGDGSVTHTIELLRIGRKLNRFSERLTVKLEPWIVQRALNRRPGQRFSLDEQRTIVAATRTPSRVDWPDWWRIRRT